MRKAQEFAKKITGWELLLANLTPHLAEMPYLQEIASALVVLIAEARNLDGEQELARAHLQDIIHRRQAVERDGETLRIRATSHLKGSFGLTSDELVRFGIRPRPFRLRRRQPPVETPPSPPPPE